MNHLILRKSIVLFLALIFIPLVACSQARFLTEMPKGESTSKVYINKTMVTLGNKIAGHYAGEYADIMKEINGIEVYSCSNPNLINQVKDVFSNLLTKTKLEELVYVEDDVEEVYIYGHTNIENSIRADATLSGIVIYTMSPGQINIIVIHGEINIDAIARMTQK